MERQRKQEVPRLWSAGYYMGDAENGWTTPTSTGLHLIPYQLYSLDFRNLLAVWSTGELAQSKSFILTLPI